MIQITPTLLFAFIEVESGFRSNAFLNDRDGGSYGLMQLDLATAQDRGYKGAATGLYEPRDNVTYGRAVLVWIAADLDKHGLCTVANVAAAYNAGLGHVLGGGGDPAYSAKIEAAYAAWKTILGEPA